MTTFVFGCVNTGLVTKVIEPAVPLLALFDSGLIQPPAVWKCGKAHTCGAVAFSCYGAW